MVCTQNVITPPPEREAFMASRGGILKSVPEIASVRFGLLDSSR